MPKTPESGKGDFLDPAELARKVSAQAVYERPKTKRFYKAVSLEEQQGGFALALDGRSVKTPLKQTLIIPNSSLAKAVAGEWEQQGEFLDPNSMMLTKLCNTAVDRVRNERGRIVDEIVDYANADLLCYRAERPAELVVRQCKLWDPVLDWAAQDLGAHFAVLAGVVHQDQSDECLAAVRRFVDGLSDFAVAGYHNIMTMTGSAVLATASARGHLQPDEVWALAHVDEDWQIEQWGKDEEEAERRAGRRAEFMEIQAFLKLVV